MYVHHALMMIMKNKYGHVLMSIEYYCMQQYSQIRDEIGGSGGHTLMARDQHHGSSCGPPRGCAMLPMRTSGGSFVPIDDLVLLCCMLCYR